MAAVASSALCSAGSVQAQSTTDTSAAAAGQSASPSAPATLPASSIAGDIVVTAQRRAESIQTTPVAVTAFSAETIANYGIHDFADYAKSVPGLSYGTGGSASTATQAYGVSSTRQVTIRGVAGVNTTSLYVDDTPIPAAVDVRVLDLDRIEVLRGPQGTLFGAASMGGTIKLVTKQPDMENSSGSITVQGTQTDHAGAGYDVGATLNIPLVKDSLSLRVSGFANSDPGYFTKYYGVPVAPGVNFLPGEQVIGQQDHVGGSHSYGGIATLSWQPASLERLKLSASAIYQQEKTDGYPVAIGDPHSYAQPQPINQPEYSNSNFQFYSLTGHYQLDFGTIISSTSFFLRHANEDQDATAYSAYFSPSVFGVTSPYLPSSATVALEQKIFTEEVRFESSFHSKFQIVAGAFYQRTRDGYNYLLSANGFDANNNAVAVFYANNAPSIQTNVAGFADLTFNVTSKFHLSAGVRVASQRNKLNDFLASYGSPNSDVITHQHDSPVTPRFLAEYRFDSSNIVYASASKGFRPGGTNSLIVPSCEPEQFGFKSDDPNPFKSDSLWSYEVGVKNAFLDHKVITRAAGYHIDWSNLQQSVSIPTCALTGTLNVGKTKIDGAEFEITVLPLPGFSINGAMGYTDARITKAGLAGSGNVIGAAVGQPLNGVPKWTGSVRAEYDWRLRNLNMFLRGQYSYTGASVSYVNGFTPRARYQLVDLRTGFNLDVWTFSIFANNIFDVKPNLGDIAQLSGQLPGLPQYLIGQPRTIGLELRRTF
jgi:iron complex outermembrane receptor protein